jgi:pimeloyl-ACP methyl ester carboxylesterase
MDLAGHGRSDHRHPSSSYNYTSFASDVLDVAEGLGWTRYALLGHSLGAAISSLVASAFPERITAMAMIDNIGPLSRPVGELVGAYRKHYLALSSGFAVRKKPVYATLEEAIQARAGGLVPVSLDSARILISRGLEEITLPNGSPGFQWSTDKLLLLPNAFNYTEESVRGILGAIKTPTQVIVATGEKAWLMTTFREMTEGRLEVLRKHHSEEMMRIVLVRRLTVHC